MQVLGSCQKRFPLTQKEVDLASHPVVGLVVQVGDAENFPQALSFEGLDPFFQSQQAGSMSHSHMPPRRMEMTRHLHNLNLLVTFSLAITARLCCGDPDAESCRAGAIRTQGRSEYLKLVASSNF